MSETIHPFNSWRHLSGTSRDSNLRPRGLALVRVYFRFLCKWATALYTLLPRRRERLRFACRCVHMLHMSEGAKNGLCVNCPDWMCGVCFTAAFKSCWTRGRRAILLSRCRYGKISVLHSGVETRSLEMTETTTASDFAQGEEGDAVFVSLRSFGLQNFRDFRLQNHQPCLFEKYSTRKLVLLDEANLWTYTYAIRFLSRWYFVFDYIPLGRFYVFMCESILWFLLPYRT